MAITLFQMFPQFRQYLIANHEFYVEQAQKRLLSQFENIEDEATKHSEEWLLKMGNNYFDPERHDPSDLYEQSFDEASSFYQLLDEMSNRTRLSVIAGLFHEWEKQLHSWMIKEIRHWHDAEEVKKQVWQANVNRVADFFEALGWAIKSQKYYESLVRCTLVVNAYKHGDGRSFEEIKKRYPEFISTFGTDAIRIEYADHSDLTVNANHIAEFSSAVTAFWNDIPEFITGDDKTAFPSWFENARKIDLGLTG